MYTRKPLLVHKNSGCQGQRNKNSTVSAVWDSSTRPVAQEYLTLLEEVQTTEQVLFLFPQVDLSSHLELCVFLASQRATLQTVN